MMALSLLFVTPSFFSSRSLKSSRGWGERAGEGGEKERERRERERERERGRHE